MDEDIDRFEEAGQSVFRPSYSATTLNCLGSLLPSNRVPNTAGYEAAVGTVFHQLIAEWQLTEARPDYLLGRVQVVDKFEVEIDDDMFIFAEECLQRYADIPGERFVEVRVDISSLTPIPGQSGTADLIIARPQILDVVDWKYGKGVKVYAKDNTQELCYAWGVFKRYDSKYNFQTVRLHIAQPRLGHYDVWEISRDDLIEFAEWARVRWAAAWRPDAPRTPGPKQCQWCKVRIRCPALQKLMQDIADDTFEVLDEVAVSAEAQQQMVATNPVEVTLSPPGELDTARLAWIYRYRRTFENWFRDIGEELLRRGMQGDNLGGLWTVSRGRPGRRKWVDQNEAAAALLKLGVKDVYDIRAISPRQAERQLRMVGVRGKLGKDYVNLYTDRSDGRPTLVPIGDNRISLAEIVDDTFETDDDEL